MKIVTILGARPQFIKAGTVSREIQRQKDEGRRLKEVIVHTGQHYDANMSDIFFEEMQIPKPDYFLGIGGKTHGAMTGQMIEKIEEVCFKEKPDWILVYGDTNSTLAGSIVASKMHIKLAHVEAGLRSFNMQMPEEVNRIITDRVSNILFCPTDTAVKNLKKEGFPFPTASNQQLITNVGDVMYDGALFYKNLAKKPNIKGEGRREKGEGTNSSTFYLQPSTFILCTIHRAENTDNPKRLKDIFEALENIAKDTQIVLPLHPRTKKIIQNSKFKIQNLTIIDPVGYLEMVWLISNAKLIMTDSGGLQKEAYFFEKPCMTLRDETEWVELVEIGANILVGADKEKIIKAYKAANNQYSNKQYTNLLYGDGTASKKIIEFILNYKEL